MKTILFFITAFLCFGCSKSEPKTDDETKLANVELVFSTGNYDSDGGYRVNSTTKSFSNLNSIKTYKETLKTGDNITMFMNRRSTSGQGNFSLRLMVNGKQVQEVNGNDKLNIQLVYILK